MDEKQFRIEHDLLGEREISQSCYYGVQTLRASENYNITGVPISHYPRFIHYLAYLKKAAAMANLKLGLLSSVNAAAIVKACDEIIAGKYHDQFIVDVIQGGAGTSTNMNANEVIANLALEVLGHKKGQYDIIHPLNHVNMSQSTNDIYPTAIRLTLSMKLDGLLVEMEGLQKSLLSKGEEFADVLKVARTQLQDAIPITLGQEFTAYAIMVARIFNVFGKRKV